jgi:hypothetical protein
VAAKERQLGELDLAAVESLARDGLLVVRDGVAGLPE